MSDTSEAVRLFENSPGWWDEAAWERVKAENARLRGDLDTALGLRKMESRRADRLREQAETLAEALEGLVEEVWPSEMIAEGMKPEEGVSVAGPVDGGTVADARTALRAYREATHE